MLTAAHLMRRIDLPAHPQTARMLLHHDVDEVLANPTADAELLEEIRTSFPKAKVQQQLVARRLPDEVRTAILTAEKRPTVLTNLLHHNDLSADELVGLAEGGKLTGRVMGTTVSRFGYLPELRDHFLHEQDSQRLVALTYYATTGQLTDEEAAEQLASFPTWKTTPLAGMGLYIRALQELGPKARSAAIAAGQDPFVLAAAASHRDYTRAEQFTAARLTEDGELHADLAQQVAGRPDDISEEHAVLRAVSATWMALAASPWTDPDVVAAIGETLERLEQDDNGPLPHEVREARYSVRSQVRGRARRGVDGAVPKDPSAWDDNVYAWMLRRLTGEDGHKRFPEAPLLFAAPQIVERDVCDVMDSLRSEALRFWWPRVRQLAIEVGPRVGADGDELADAYLPEWRFDRVGPGSVGRADGPRSLPRQAPAFQRHPIGSKTPRQLFSDEELDSAMLTLEEELGDDPRAWETLVTTLTDLADLTVDQLVLAAKL